MGRVLVLQHVAAEPLGVLDPALRARGHRIRYVNFARAPDLKPHLERYEAMIVLGGPMSVTDTASYPHLKTEYQLIEGALRRQMPTLGICLGGQLISYVLGGRVRLCRLPEIGWYQIAPTEKTGEDPVLAALDSPQRIFQWHHWEFDCPPGSTSIACHAQTGCQAFRYGMNIWGFQFHLELDERLINRWLSLPSYQQELSESGLETTPEEIQKDSSKYLPKALKLAEQVFGSWIGQVGKPKSRIVLPSR